MKQRMAAVFLEAAKKTPSPVATKIFRSIRKYRKARRRM